MEVYNCTLHEVLDADTQRLNVDIGGSQTIVIKFRNIGVQAPLLNKRRQTTMKGAAAFVYKHEVLKWFNDRSSDLTIYVYGKDLCGRWIGSLFAFGDPVSLTDYLKERYLTDDNWTFEVQQDLIQDWFAGEEVTIPGRDRLPLFRIWGRPLFRGFRSTQFNRIG